MLLYWTGNRLKEDKKTIEISGLKLMVELHSNPSSKLKSQSVRF